jgi:ABC-type transport system substrate-binding protein
LEANPNYWDPTRFPRLQRIVFDNTLDSQKALELVKTREGRVDIVTGLSPLETLRVAQSPFAKVVKARNSLESIFGMFNMRKVDSPWHDVRLRQAVNYAINRDDLIRYATKGNGVIVPALLAVDAFGYDPNLAPYPFDPATARRLRREAGHPDGLAISLIAPRVLEVQATVVSKMLEQSGFAVDLQVLDVVTFNQQTVLSDLDQPPEHQPWDIALTSWSDVLNFPVFQVYHMFALDGRFDWLMEQPALRQLREQVLRTVDQETQQALIRQLERHASEQAYFLFLYNPIQLYAVNKAVNFVPYVNVLILAETAVTAQHWSVRQQKAAGHE